MLVIFFRQKLHNLTVFSLANIKASVFLVSHAGWTKRASEWVFCVLFTGNRSKKNKQQIN